MYYINIITQGKVLNDRDIFLLLFKEEYSLTVPSGREVVGSSSIK